MILTIFGAPTKSGGDLSCRASDLAKRLGYSVSQGNPVKWSLDIAATSSDVILFDGTIEDEQQHNYHAAYLFPHAIDQLLVVARSYLPINFMPVRRGGAPDYPFPHFHPQLDRVRRSWSNDNILKWLEEQLLDFREHGQRPKGLFSLGRDLRRTLRQRADVSDRVFVSYRSRLYDKVESLKDRIKRGELHNGQPKIVELLPPGALAYEGELLTAMRRWQLLNQIDQLIGSCEEMIVYYSDDYLNSWWTKGEVVTLAYRRSERSTSQPNLRVYDPSLASERLINALPDLMPTMSKSQCRRMSWLSAHTHPRLVEPGSVMFSRRVHKALRKSHAIDRKKYEAAPRLWNLVGFFKDKIWDDKFWDEVLFECPYHRQLENGCGIDLDGFLSERPEHMVGLAPDQIEEAVGRGAISCSLCHRNHALVTAPPRYLWSPLRRGEDRTAGRTGLTRLDTYVMLADA